MLMLLPENMNISYSSPYQGGFNYHNTNIVITNNNDNNIPNLANSKNNVKHNTLHQKKHFAICKSCFWCATYLISNVKAASKYCPICNYAKVELLPVDNDLID